MGNCMENIQEMSLEDSTSVVALNLKTKNTSVTLKLTPGPLVVMARKKPEDPRVLSRNSKG